MAVSLASKVLIHPHFMEPEFLVQYNQHSGAFNTLPGGAPDVKLSPVDQVVYMKKLEFRGTAKASQVPGMQLPGVSLIGSLIQTPTYFVRSRAEYDHHDAANAGEWGLSIAEAYRLGQRQAHFILMRSALLYGINAAKGEGLLNTAGATAATLPADPYGVTTISGGYDYGAMLDWLLGQFVSLRSRCYQYGQPSRFVFVGPQRILGTLETRGIIQLTQYQRPGAGVATVPEAIGHIIGAEGSTFEWHYDDTLIGKGAGGTDAVLLVVPEFQKPKPEGTNVIANIKPGTTEAVRMYVDRAAPTEYTTPISGSASGIDVISEQKITSGWGIRPEALSILSMQY